MTAITPGTHLVVGEAFTETIPAGTPFVSIFADGDINVYQDGTRSDRTPTDYRLTRHHLTVEAPIPTPDEFQPGAVVTVEFIRNADRTWSDPDGELLEGAVDDTFKRWLDHDAARLTHVPTPPAKTRQDAVDALAGLGWTTDAIEDAIGAQSGADVRGGGEA